ncbi:MAG: potassium channel family protein [Chloroflexi bacterium]|nr:potassium channel family protein [Chloroflexota bacterium]MBU1750045.1 potassium channel family protein [Chloroflexota bacterium]
MNSVEFRLRVFLIVLAGVIILGTLGFMALEGASWTDAVYFVVITIATVGYGDIHPTTPAGRLFAIGLIVAGVGTFLGVIANATDWLLSRREVRARTQKLNVVISLFFSELGTPLLAACCALDPHLDEWRQQVLVTPAWTAADFARARAPVAGRSYTVAVQPEPLAHLSTFLRQQDTLLLNLLASPYLLEHEAFTDLLRAIAHLRQELLWRVDRLAGRSFAELPAPDQDHLAADITRVYAGLAGQWLEYMRYLQVEYPYLFSLAVRTNPFDRDASPIIR